MSDAFALTLLLLAQEDAPRNTGPDFGKASPFGLIIVILLLLATFGLVWSMNRQLKKVPQSFDEQSFDEPAAGAAPTVDEVTMAVEPDSAAIEEDSRREPGG